MRTLIFGVLLVLEAQYNLIRLTGTRFVAAVLLLGIGMILALAQDIKELRR